MKAVRPFSEPNASPVFQPFNSICIFENLDFLPAQHVEQVTHGFTSPSPCVQRIPGMYKLIWTLLLGILCTHEGTPAWWFGDLNPCFLYRVNGKHTLRNTSKPKLQSTLFEGSQPPHPPPPNQKQVQPKPQVFVVRRKLNPQPLPNPSPPKLSLLTHVFCLVLSGSAPPPPKPPPPTPKCGSHGAAQPRGPGRQRPTSAASRRSRRKSCSRS